jgi:hypothetical protein
VKGSGSLTGACTDILNAATDLVANVVVATDSITACTLDATKSIVTGAVILVQSDIDALVVDTKALLTIVQGIEVTVTGVVANVLPGRHLIPYYANSRLTDCTAVKILIGAELSVVLSVLAPLVTPITAFAGACLKSKSGSGLVLTDLIASVANLTEVVKSMPSSY